MSTPVLGYWNIRALGEPIRFLLHYQGVKFEDRQYPVENQSTWFEKDKFNLGLDFPDLPYLIDGDVRMTQSTAILRYLARKYDLAGVSEEEKIRVMLAEQQVIELRSNNIGLLAYDPEFEAHKDDFIRKLPSLMQPFSVFLGDRKYFAGDHITYVDFMAYHVFDFCRLLVPDMLDDLKNLDGFMARIENLPAIKKYMKLPAYKRWPIFLPSASFGGKGEEPQRKH